MISISSQDNQWLKRLRALGKRKYRIAFEQFVAEGRRFVQEALSSAVDVHAVFVAEEEKGTYQDLLATYTGPVYSVSRDLLNESLSTVHPQSIAAIVSFPQWDTSSWEDMETLVVVDGVQDPGNLGSIIRTTAASGGDAVLCLKGTVDFSNEKVLRATMGAIFSLPVFMIDDTEETLADIKDRGFHFIAADAQGRDYDEIQPWPEKIALFMGSEGHGVQEDQEDFEEVVRIPLERGVESLNVGVAAGILLYAIRRDRKRRKA